MPMFFARRNPDHVARSDLAHRSTLGLNPAHARDDIQRLAQRVRMPIRSRARLKGYAVGDKPRRRLRCDDWILQDRAGEPLLGRATGGPRTGEMDIHGTPPVVTGAVSARPCYFLVAA